MIISETASTAGFLLGYAARACVSQSKQFMGLLVLAALLSPGVVFAYNQQLACGFQLAEKPSNTSAPTLPPDQMVQLRGSFQEKGDCSDAIGEEPYRVDVGIRHQQDVGRRGASLLPVWMPQLKASIIISETTILAFGFLLGFVVRSYVSHRRRLHAKKHRGLGQVPIW
jgi:hypothetical protein